MSIRQVYFTSCETGADGIRGFQVNAASPELDRSIIDTGLRLSAYRPSPGTPSRPTAEQLAAFPISVGYRPFEEYRILWHSRYLGADFTGRQGNYFAHILVMDGSDRQPNGTLPIDAWESPVWRWTKTDNPLLPTLPTLPGGRLANSSVGDDLRNGRIPEFVEVLSAVQRALGRSSARIVLVAERDREVARAIASVTRSLPHEIATTVSFTTFSSTPAEADVLIVGTTPDSLPSSTASGAHQVITLGATSTRGLDSRGGDFEPTRYARLMQRCLQRDDTSARDVLALASSLRPVVQAAELDDFTEFAEFVVPDIVGGDADLLRALEFGVARCPELLTAPTWGLVARLSSATGTMTELRRWSGVLETAHGLRLMVPTVIDSRYLNAALTAIHRREFSAADLWLPTMSDRNARTAIDWAGVELTDATSVSSVAGVLRTLDAVGVVPPAALLRDVAVNVVVPHLTEASTASAAIAELRKLEPAREILTIACETIEQALDSEGMFEAYAENLPAETARLLLPLARQRSQLALMFHVVRARAGQPDIDGVGLIADAVQLFSPAPPADTVSRLARLIWTAIPPAVDAHRLLETLGDETAAATGLAPSICQRLVADACTAGLTDEDAALARSLVKPMTSRGLAAEQLLNVRAVLTWALFNGSPQYAEVLRRRAVDDLNAFASVEPEIRRDVVTAIAEWTAGLRRAEDHRDALLAISGVPRTQEFMSAYRASLEMALDRESPEVIAEILIALVSVGARRPEVNELLDVVAGDALSRRRKRDLTDIRGYLDENSETLQGLLIGAVDRSGPRNWVEWWDTWQESNLRRSFASRLFGRRNSGKAPS